MTDAKKVSEALKDMAKRAKGDDKKQLLNGAADLLVALEAKAVAAGKIAQAPAPVPAPAPARPPANSPAVVELLNHIATFPLTSRSSTTWHLRMIALAKAAR